jgi:small subunit ribosomal protein S17
MKVKITNIIDSKTAKVLSTTYKKHEKYGKYITIHKKFIVDTNGMNVEVGQDVEIKQSRPISKRKKWSIKI